MFIKKIYSNLIINMNAPFIDINEFTSYYMNIHLYIFYGDINNQLLYIKYVNNWYRYHNDDLLKLNDYVDIYTNKYWCIHLYNNFYLVRNNHPQFYPLIYLNNNMLSFTNINFINTLYIKRMLPSLKDLKLIPDIFEYNINSLKEKIVNLNNLYHSHKLLSLL